MSLAIALGLISFATAVASALIAASSRRASERFRAGSQARSRLQVATGALQLELFLETRSFARRLEHHFRESGSHPLETYRDHASPGSYHAGGMMIYRILRPLTVGEIIESQTLAGDLLLDPGMMEMIKFGQAAVELLTGDKLGREFGGGKGSFEGFDMDSCWDVGRPGTGYQRIRGSYLRCGAAALLAPQDGPGEPRRCITHAEFCKLWEQQTPKSNPEHHLAFHEGLEPMKATLHRFDRHQNPVLWLRLVGYAYACEKFYERMWQSLAGKRFRQRLRHLGRTPVEIETIGVPAVEMLENLGEGEAGRRPLNSYIAANAAGFVERFDTIVDRAL